MSDKKSIEYIIKKSSAFKEDIRKSLLLHVVNENEGLLIEKITLSVNSETTDFTSETAHIPFIFSMLSGSDLQLPDSWRNADFIQSIVTPSTSQHNNDTR